MPNQDKKLDNVLNLVPSDCFVGIDEIIPGLYASNLRSLLTDGGSNV